MYRYSQAVLIAAACMLSTPGFAAVSLTQWGASASTASADCSLLNCSKVDFLLFNPIVPGTGSGGLNQVSASIIDDAAPQGRGTASASADIAGGFGVPVLKARAESVDANGWVSGTALAVQGFQFTGADGTLVTLDASLSGTVNNTSGSDVTGLSVGLWLMRDTPSFSFPNPVAGLDGLLLELALLPIADSMSWDALATGAVDRSTTTTDPSDQLSISLNNGDEFYLLAALVAAADGTGAYADAFSTLEMQFNTTELVAASTVPVPGALWLLVSGLPLLPRVARRVAGG